MNTFDLQIQSTASDGKHAPREIVQMAAKNKLRVISLTDHDTVAGVTEAILAARECGLRVIPGIEISVEERGVHILGYGIDCTNQDLYLFSQNARQVRMEGAKKMVENLKNYGFVISWEDVLKETRGGVVARPHIARAVLGREENKAKLGDVDSVHDFIESFLTEQSPNYVRRSHISAKDAIALIHRSGGVAIWSHPAIHFKSDYDGLEKFMEMLLSCKIDGIEIFNPSHTEDDVEFLWGLKTKYRILGTAGSDFHEAGSHPRDPASGLHSAETVGDYETYGFPAKDIIFKLEEAIAVVRQRPNV